MSFIALILVIFSTLCHAYWNLILKRTTGGIHFIWLFTVITIVLYIPFVIMELDGFYEMMNDKVFIVCIGSMIFHLMYFLFLDKAYEFGELSIIYPVARGIAPVITIIIAITFLNEKMTGAQIVSVGLIMFGTFILSGFSYKSGKAMSTSLVYAVACGIMVASYTVIDKVAVANYNISPFILDFINNVGRAVVLVPLVSKDIAQLEYVRKVYLKEAAIIAVLSPLSYVLILFAMKNAPVSLISPLRQFSIVIGATLGIKLLCESKEYIKLAGILITLFGVVWLSL